MKKRYEKTRITSNQEHGNRKDTQREYREINLINNKQWVQMEFIGLNY